MEHFIEDYSKSEDVWSKTVLASLQGLQTHIERRTEIELFLTKFLFLDGKTKVSQLAVPFLQQNILWFDVSVDNAYFFEFG